jgi:phosphatidylglycerophosphate synthase
MGFFTEYKKSLKLSEVEEFIDILIFRPAGYLIMKIFYYTSATPNLLTFISMILGLASGILFAQTKQVYLFYGIAALFLSNSFDCADGQLARAKKNGTKFGRIFDGVIDYLTYIAVYVGMAYHLHITTLAGKTYLNPFPDLPWMWWVFMVIAGISTSIQTLLYDGARNDFTNYAKGSDKAFIESEYQKFKSEHDEIKNQKGRLREKFLYRVYLSYLNVQMKSVSSDANKVDKDEYYKKNRVVMRLWGLVGSTSHLVFIMICAVFARFDIYVWGIIIAYNFVTLILWLTQKIINKNIKQISKST